MHSAKIQPHPAEGPAPTGTAAARLLVRLRSSTAAAHARVEDRLFPSALADRASYATMLQTLLALHEPLEARLHGDADLVAAFAGLGVDLADRRKAHRLRADLAGLDADARTRRPAPPAPDLPDLPHALGAFYVLEGSTLGGRVLLGEVRARLGDVPTSFFAGYGDETGRYWRRTRTALTDGIAADADPEGAADRLVAGALATFGHLDRLIDDARRSGPGRERVVPTARGGGRPGQRSSA